MDEDEPPQNAVLREVGFYAKLSQARERGLVLAAMDLPHWIVRQGQIFALLVEEGSTESALWELQTYEAERGATAESPPQPSFEAPPAKLDSLYTAALVMSGFWAIQNVAPPEWVERGFASSHQILAGQWWRTFTALTLHGDFSHFAANTAAGLMFAGFALRHFGTGWCWLAIVLGGALGNGVNALFYSSQDHVSLGASTAVFGALGLIVGAETLQRISSPLTRGRWQLILPIGAGLGLLAFLGVGDPNQHTDYMAHFWGLIVGTLLGAVGAHLRVRERTSAIGQRLASGAAVALLGSSWWLAAH